MRPIDRGHRPVHSVTLAARFEGRSDRPAPSESKGREGMTGLLAAVLSGAVILMLGRIHSDYLDVNDRIARRQRRLDY
jgi:hypothetical protein